jgi:CRISPR-associated endonuclease Cas1
MAALPNLPHPVLSDKSAIGKNGVLTIHGYGVRVLMQSGHLEIEDGIGPDRHKIRLARVAHGLKRLVCISEDGFVTLAALKWLSDVGASFVMLTQAGKPLFITGPTSTNDARLRRAQSLALGNGVGLAICRVLIDAKLQGQERLAKECLADIASAKIIASCREKVWTVDSFDAIRLVEAQAALYYFAAWRDTPVLWPKSDLSKIPDHWKTVGNRQSPLSDSPRLAINPVQAILNYCFALLEAETRIAISAIGLDRCLGLGLHTDTANRDSLVFDVLEPVRPHVEDWVLNWIKREPLRRADFFEASTGNCRIKNALAARLGDTSPTWSKLVAPWAEYVAQELWKGVGRKDGRTILPTHLTQQHRRQAKGGSEPSKVFAPHPQKVCLGCGQPLKRTRRKHCAACGVAISRANLIQIAYRGRIASKSPESLAKQSAAQKRQRAARRQWNPDNLPVWLTLESYREMVLPKLAHVTVPTIAASIRVSEPYASRLRKGMHIPHPMHWQTLAELTGVSNQTN